MVCEAHELMVEDIKEIKGDVKALLARSNKENGVKVVEDKKSDRRLTRDGLYISGAVGLFLVIDIIVRTIGYIITRLRA